MAGTGSAEECEKNDKGTQLYVFQVHARTEPHEKVLLTYKLRGQIPITVEMVQKPMTRFWVSPEVSVRAGQVMSYTYLIRHSESGEDKPEAAPMRRRLTAKQISTRPELVDDGQFRFEWPGCDPKVWRPGISSCPKAALSHRVSPWLSSTSAPVQQDASLESRLRAEMTCVEAKIRAKFEKQLSDMKRHVTTLLDDHKSHTASSMRRVEERLEAVDQTLQSLKAADEEQKRSHQHFQEEVLSQKLQSQLEAAAAASENLRQEVLAVQERQKQDREWQEQLQLISDEGFTRLKGQLRELQEADTQTQSALSQLGEEHAKMAQELPSQRQVALAAAKGASEQVQELQEQLKLDRDELRRCEEGVRRLQRLAETQQERASKEAMQVEGQLRELQEADAKTQSVLSQLREQHTKMAQELPSQWQAALEEQQKCGRDELRRCMESVRQLQTQPERASKEVQTDLQQQLGHLQSLVDQHRSLWTREIKRLSRELDDVRDMMPLPSAAPAEQEHESEGGGYFSDPLPHVDAGPAASSPQVDRLHALVWDAIKDMQQTRPGVA